MRMILIERLVRFSTSSFSASSLKCFSISNKFDYVIIVACMVSQACGGWKISKERSIELLFAWVGYCVLDLRHFKGKIIKAKNDFEERVTSFLFSPFRSGFSWSFFSSCCSFFIIWHFPLQFILGFALFSQFFAYLPVLV